MDEPQILAERGHGASFAPMSMRPLIARAELIARSNDSPLSAGGIAGAVIGSVVGAVVIAFCAYPFIVRYLRKRRGDVPFDPEAEIQAAQQEAMNGSANSPVTKQLSMDQYGRGQPSSEDSNAASMFKNGMAQQPSPGSPQNGQSAAAICTPPPDRQQQSPNLDPMTGPQRAATNLTATTFGTQMTTPPPEKERRGSQASTWSALSKAMRSTTSVFRRTSERSMPHHYASQDSSWTQAPTGQPMYQEPLSMAPVTTTYSTSGAAAAYYYPEGVPVTQLNTPMTAQPDISTFADAQAFSHMGAETQLGQDISQGLQQPDHSNQKNNALMTPSQSPDMVNQSFNGTPASGLQMFGTPIQGQGMLSLPGGSADDFTYPLGTGQLTANGLSLDNGTVNPQDLNALNIGLMPDWQAGLGNNGYPSDLGKTTSVQHIPNPSQMQMNDQQFSNIQHQQQQNIDIPIGDINAMDNFFEGVPGYTKSEAPKTEITPPMQQYPQTTSAAPLQPYQSSPPLAAPYTPVVIKSEPDMVENFYMDSLENAFDPAPNRQGHKRDYSHSSVSVGIPSNFANTPSTHITGTSSSYSGSLSPCPPPQQGMSPGEASGSEAPKPFKCPDCGREFEEKHKLNHHVRYHDRKYRCTYTDCTATFGTKTHLERHVNDKHTKSKGFHCSVEGCPYSRVNGKSFPRKDNWRRHMQNKHKRDPDQEPVVAAEVDAHMAES
ncbi:hypothetical protein PoMZ_12860 [Pyricularia oryzae]|uniref:C2H2 type master regulator of conidiophore development brlA n=1 Tax=Pyricularia oryzae TaxID=318829 RepID=A0A4P7NTW4_PYROR|nr:hypothetical protein PoMZ_12860 [Pyricularia oryzae]